MPHAVLSLPSIANWIGPVTRLLFVLSKKFGSSGASAWSTSADAPAISTFVFLSGSAADAASTENSVSAHVPLKERPGPPHGRFGSVNNSRRIALMPSSVVVARQVAVIFVGA